MKAVFGIIGVWLLSFCISQNVFAQFNFENEPLPKIFQKIEDETGYRFLYRESQIADINLTFESGKTDFTSHLSTGLNPFGLTVNADTIRQQIVIYKSRKTASKAIRINGQVVDTSTGERLPYSTRTWNTGGFVNGVAANASGYFSISSTLQNSVLTLKASYIGYRTKVITLNIAENTFYDDLTFRLEPETMSGSDIVVTGFSYTGSSDSLYRSFVDAGVLNPLGENNTTRALQSLPSVTNGTALNNGINVRGSSSDATQILLDGITIYNQSHLFGLLDSFNPQALQTSGFFYDVTPAQFPSSPGGTLSLITKTGSLNDFKFSGGVSNTAVNLTAEGPAINGRSSWLLSGRTSYLNALNWFQNDELVSFGLNIDRPKEVIADNLQELETRLVSPGDFDATFFDLHGKFYVEYENGSRLLVSSYYGGDNISQDAERLVRRFNPSNPGQRFSRQQVQTHNEWGNFSSSLAFKMPVSQSLYSQSLAAVSIYTSDFSKDDFIYNRVQPGNSSNIQVFAYPLRNESVFNELKVDQYFDYINNFAQWTFGISTQYLKGEYFEESFDRPGFLTTFESGLVDLYGQMDYTHLRDINIHLGSRLHYYTNGDFLHYSPRVKLKFFDKRMLSLEAGYSRNFQFTHRLSFYNVSSPDVWVISTADQPPTISDYFTAGAYLQPHSAFLIQIEAYYKKLDNARLFDINRQTLTETFDGPPWMYDNDGLAKGLEVLVRNQFNNIQLTNSYALSRATFQNNLIQNGDDFLADWDRTHSFNSRLDYQILPSLQLFGSFTITSGAPNRLYFLQLEDQVRLGHYERLDAGLEFRTSFESGELEFNFSVFNLMDRYNPWYRELNLVIDTSVSQNQQRLSSLPVDVYDLGIQPSFSLNIWF